MHAVTLRLAAAILLAALALAGLPACTTAYMDTLHEDMALAPDELLALRTEEARDALSEAHTALQHLDDSLRDFALTPTDGAERAGTDLRRRQEQAQAAAWDARRRIASVSDVAPGYLRSTAAADDSRAAYDDLAEALDAADRAIARALDALDRSLPTLGAAPEPRVADDLRATTQAALAAITEATDASDRLLGTLRGE